MRLWQLGLVFTALSGVLVLAPGCAGSQRQTTSIEEPAEIERPAVPLSEEESLADRIGEVGIVILALVITVGGIVVPLLLL